MNPVISYLTTEDLTNLLVANRSFIRHSVGGIHAPQQRFFRHYPAGSISSVHDIKVTRMPQVHKFKSFMIKGSNPLNNNTLHFRFVLLFTGCHNINTPTLY